MDGSWRKVEDENLAHYSQVYETPRQLHSSFSMSFITKDYRETEAFVQTLAELPVLSVPILRNTACYQQKGTERSM